MSVDRWLLLGTEAEHIAAFSKLGNNDGLLAFFPRSYYFGDNKDSLSCNYYQNILYRIQNKIAINNLEILTTLYNKSSDRDNEVNWKKIEDYIKSNLDCKIYWWVE